MRNNPDPTKSSSGFNELSRAKIGEARALVISKNAYNKGITLAQAIQTKEGHRDIDVFLKGTITVYGLPNLCNLRDALNVAIDTLEESEE